MRNRLIATALSVLLCLTGTSCAQTPTKELTFDRIDTPVLQWGDQKAEFEVTNHSDYLKFLKVETNLTFEGTYLNPERLFHTNYILPPGETGTFSVDLQMPGNYGTGLMELVVYDVVDTLDEIFPGQDVFRQPFKVRYHPGEHTIEYLTERFTVPPRVEESLDFDYEFSRLLVWLLHEGKKPAEIAEIAQCSEAYVNKTIDSLVARKYAAWSPDGPKLRFPVISLDEAQEVLTLVKDVSGKLTDVIAANLGDYADFLDQQVQAKMIPADSNEFLDGGSLLYWRYPMVTAMLLWLDLGQEFITDYQPLTVFPHSDPCNAYSPEYMYMVQGGPMFNGRQFYHLEINRRKLFVFYTDHPPVIDCVDAYWTKKQHLKERYDWRYVREDMPENFLLDTAKVYLGLRHLRKNTDKVLADARERLAPIRVAHNNNKGEFGYRYWFWNQVATRTTDALVERGLITRKGNGTYRFENR